jgi:uncharacterized membrane protein YphA (DoxX/SURF4 family)
MTENNGRRALHPLAARINHLDLEIVGWFGRHGITLLRLSIGLIFFWFGVLKFFPGVSTAEGLATRTISVLTFGLVPANVSLPVLAAWECLIGLGLLSGRFLRATLFLLFAQMAGTFLPLLFFPGETFKIFPFVPTLEGQYIIKNFVIISAALVVGSTARGGRVVTDRKVARLAEEIQAHRS